MDPEELRVAYGYEWNWGWTYGYGADPTHKFDGLSTYQTHRRINMVVRPRLTDIYGELLFYIPRPSRQTTMG